MNKLYNLKLSDFDFPDGIETDAQRINYAIGRISALNNGEDELDNRTIFYPRSFYRLQIEKPTAGAEYNLEEPLILQTRSHVICKDENAPNDEIVFNRTVSDDRKPHQCLICADATVDATWSGGTFQRVLQTFMVDGADGVPVAVTRYADGNMVDLVGKRITVSDVTVRNWRSGRAFAILGDDIVLYRPRSIAPATDVLATAGVRVTGGRGFRCFGGCIEANDDALVFAPGAIESYPDGDISIEDGAFIGTKAYGIRMINASLGASGSTDLSNGDFGVDDLNRRTTASIHNVRFIGITGKASGKAATNGKPASGRAVKVVNESSSGEIRGVSIIDCEITSLPNIDRPLVFGNAAGGVFDIRLCNVDLVDEGHISNDRLPISVFKVDGLHWTGGNIAGSNSAAGGTRNPTISLEGVRNATLRDLDVGPGAGGTILLTASPPPPTNDFNLVERGCIGVEIDNCVITVADGTTGVSLDRAETCSVTRNVFNRVLGNATAGEVTKAVKTSDEAVRCFVEANDLRALEVGSVPNSPKIVRRPLDLTLGSGSRAFENIVVESSNFDVVNNPSRAARYDVASSTVAAALVVDPLGAGLLKLTADVAKSVNGAKGGEPGRLLTLVNTNPPGGPNITIVDRAGSETIRRFLLDGNRSLAPGQGITLWYDDVEIGWRPIG